MTFQIKNIVCFIVGLFMFAGFVGLIARRRWGIPTAIAGVFGQAIMYLVEIAIFGSQFFNYPPTKAIIGIILINIAIVWYLYKNRIEPKER